ncbi:FKBP-type peptidyl-prolyl cis-trans isomerase SlyD [hydrothermal vent metagenome]|uniref:peptidylprolyl isomerase n=1 Tax=hydrothermal vent metagenome TaxID=652676 RepID=A0A3B0YTG9_9ZZZZ
MIRPSRSPKVVIAIQILRKRPIVLKGMESTTIMNMSIENLAEAEVDLLEVVQNRVIRLRFRATDSATGELLQYGDDLVYLHGGYGGAFPKVEQALQGHWVGDRVTINLMPEEGYGAYQSELVLTLPGSEFSDAELEIGEAVDGQLADGRCMTFTVTAIHHGQITLDGNHPFAGKRLNFEFEVLAIRESIEAERSAGFAFDGMFT